MGRVLVVSRNPGLGMALSAGDHEIVDVRPADFDLWVDGARGEHLDAIVIDVADPDSVLRTLTELRARAQMSPVLVVPGTGAEWDDHRLAELPSAVTLPRPVTPSLLRDAVDRLVAHGPSSLLVSSVPVTAADAPVAGSGGGGRPVSTGLGTRAGDPGAPAPVPPGVNGVDGAAPAAPAAPPTVAAPMPPSPARATGRSSMPATAAAVELVRALMSVSDELYGVGETAEVVVTNAIELSDAQAGALLLPDGRRWRVAAGVGLRPLEHRYELTPEDWLVTQVAQGRRAVVMEDTDIVRLPLRGSPLASWHHLLAVPVPRVDGVLLVARAEDPGFVTDHVEALTDLAAEAAPLIAAGLDTRALARRLGTLRDEVDATPPA